MKTTHTQQQHTHEVISRISCSYSLSYFGKMLDDSKMFHSRISKQRLYIVGILWVWFLNTLHSCVHILCILCIIMCEDVNSSYLLIISWFFFLINYSIYFYYFWFACHLSNYQNMVISLFKFAFKNAYLWHFQGSPLPHSLKFSKVTLDKRTVEVMEDFPDPSNGLCYKDQMFSWLMCLL